MNDFLDLFDDKLFLYFTANSKTEFLINQLFRDYKVTPIRSNPGYLKYQITKLINIYQPKEVINSIYNDPAAFVPNLEKFLFKRLEIDNLNAKANQEEIKAIGIIFIFLKDIDPNFKLDEN